MSDDFWSYWEAFFSAGTALIGLLVAWRKTIHPKIKAYRLAKQATKDEQAATIAKITAMSSVLLPNGGTSLYDMIRRVEASMAANSARIRAMMQLDPFNAVLETDDYGQITYTNRVWGQLTGLTESESKGFGWLLAIREDQRKKIYDEWQAAVVQKRDIDLNMPVVHAITGAETLLHCRAICIRDTASGVIGWIASIQLYTPPGT